jgi:hypothetical protein
MVAAEVEPKFTFFIVYIPTSHYSEAAIFINKKDLNLAKLTASFCYAFMLLLLCRHIFSFWLIFFFHPDMT